MYVCICNPTTDSEVRACVRQGACSLSDLQMQLGVAAQCGACACAAAAIIDEELQRHHPRAHSESFPLPVAA
jgi:bacterioferritin-associated ferredoxin